MSHLRQQLPPEQYEQFLKAYTNMNPGFIEQLPAEMHPVLRELVGIIPDSMPNETGLLGPGLPEMPPMQSTPLDALPQVPSGVGPLNSAEGIGIDAVYNLLRQDPTSVRARHYGRVPGLL